MIKVSAVSYINTYPFLYGLEHGEIRKEIDLSLDVPSETANKLLNDQVDLALVPVSVLHQKKDLNIISEYCIASDGDVDTVCLFSNVPLEEIKYIILDSQSFASVELIKILVKVHWKINVKFIASKPGYEDKISGQSAGLIIGDRAIYWKDKFKFRFDLGSAWKEFCSLPFVYAVWVSNKQLPKDFLERFTSALGYGVAHIDEVVTISTDGNHSAADHFVHFHDNNADFDIRSYLTEKVQFLFDENKKNGLEHFLSLLPSISASTDKMKMTANE